MLLNMNEKLKPESPRQLVEQLPRAYSNEPTTVIILVPIENAPRY